MTVGQRPTELPVVLAGRALQLLEERGITTAPWFARTVNSGIRWEAWARPLVQRGSTSSRSTTVNVHVTGDGPPVVLVNGWTASGLVWPERLVEALSERFTVARVDNRGTGWSRRMPRPYTIADLADDVRAVIDDLGGPCVVVGLSMGGMIAQELALRHPDHVAHLVLLGSRPPIPEVTLPPPRMSTLMLDNPRPGEPLDEFMRSRWGLTTAPGFAEAHPEVVDELAGAIVARVTPRGAVQDQARAIAGWSGAHRLRNLRVPATVVHGELDPLSPVRNGMRLAQLIPGARYVELAGVGHLVPYEAPDVVRREVEAAAAGPRP